jgi:hypothetical protein
MSWLCHPASDPQHREMPMLRRLLLATIGLLASASVSAQTPPSEPSPPAATESPGEQETMEDPQIGDHWTYEVRDDVSGDLKSTITFTITDMSPNEFGIRLAVVGKPDVGYQSYSRSWDLMNNGIWRFTPNDGAGIRAPLSVGKTWSFKGTDSNSSAGVSLKRSGTSKVTAKETITTRAGTFETFKIETSIETRNSNDPTKKYSSEQQTWFAPAINHWVKRSYVTRSERKIRDRSAVELVEYGRR